MPALTNPRWEKACQLRASGKEVLKSYVEAGYVKNTAAATLFFQRPNITARLIELQEQRYGDTHRAREIAIKKVVLEDTWIIERAKYVVVSRYPTPMTQMDIWHPKAIRKPD